MSALNNKAMIVTLNVSCWTARKQDKKVSAEIEEAHGAKAARNYNKLLIDKAHLDPLTKYAGAIRQMHYRLTLPWMDNGGRLLPSKLFMKYRNEMETMKNEYQNLVNVFINLYDPQLIQAARVRLGTMYNPEDYPSGKELRGKFGVELDIIPVPRGEDFRVDIADSEVSRVRDEITQRMLERQQQAAKDARARVREVVSTIQLRLSAPKPIIRDSLISNAQELVALLPGLNVMDDPALASVTQQITDNLLADVYVLRNNQRERTRVASAAERILEAIPT